MIREAIEEICQLKEATVRSEIVRPDCEPCHVYWLFNDGKYERIEAAPHPRDFLFGDLGDLIAVAVREAEPIDVLIGPHTICLCHKPGVRSSWSLSLGHSDAWRRLKKLDADRSGMDHAAMVRMLRVDLAECVPADFLEQVRRLKIEKREDGESHLRHGDESISRAVRNKVMAGDSGLVPEIVDLTVPVYEARFPPLVSHPVRCLFDVDPADGSCSLIPLGGELESAEREMQRLLWEYVTAAVKARDDIRVFRATMSEKE